MKMIGGSRLFLDVIHSTGELNTIVLSSSTSGFTDTTCVKSYFQAGGHSNVIDQIMPHPFCPIIIVTDLDKSLIIWKNEFDALEQLGKFKLENKISFEWLNMTSFDSNGSEVLYCAGVSIFQDGASLYIFKVSTRSMNDQKSSSICEVKSGNLEFEVCLQRNIDISGELVSILPTKAIKDNDITTLTMFVTTTNSYWTGQMSIDFENTNNTHLLMEKSEYYGSIIEAISTDANTNYPNFYSSRCGNVLTMLELPTEGDGLSFNPIGKPFIIPNGFSAKLIKPGLVIGWRHFQNIFTLSLYTSMHDGFGKWKEADIINMKVPDILCDEKIHLHIIPGTVRYD